MTPYLNPAADHAFLGQLGDPCTTCGKSWVRHGVVDADELADDEQRSADLIRQGARGNTALNLRGMAQNEAEAIRRAAAIRQMTHTEYVVALRHLHTVACRLAGEPGSGQLASALRSLGLQTISG